MRKLHILTLMVLLAASNTVAAQSNTSATPGQDTRAADAAMKKKRGPVFRASNDQIKQAQSMLKERTFYNGEQTGKLNAETRAALKKYQEAESIKVTGTLNRATLEKMNIQLTDKQRSM